MSTITRSDCVRQVRRLAALVETIPAQPVAWILNVLEGPGCWRGYSFDTLQERNDARDYCENVLGVPTSVDLDVRPVVVANKTDLPF